MSASRSACKLEIFLGIERGDTEQVQRIVNAYPDLVNIKACNGWTPILFAARYG